MKYKAFMKSDVGRIQNTLSGEISRVIKSYETYFGAIEQAILVIVYICFAFFAHTQFTLFVTLGGLTTSLLYSAIYKKTKKLSLVLTNDSHKFQGYIIQHIANFKYLKATGNLKVYSEKLKSTIFNIERTNKKIGILNAILTSAREPLLIIVIAAVILIQTVFLESPLGPIIITLLFLYRALTSLLVLQNQWNSFLGLSGSVHNMVTMQNELQLVQEKSGAKTFTAFSSKIAINKLNFYYGKKEVLHDINIEILKNQIIAFVGQSGSGKTTLVNIIAGLMPINEGEMTIDGISRNELNIISYQKRIGYITQDPVIFNDTIFNNITFWAQPTQENIDRFYKAISQAEILDFINSLPEKENTELGVNGINVSGGQKQRISIARELFKDIDILIMDEATSSLDSETEELIQKNINSLKGKYTIIIIAHRLSTIKNADVIYFMINGRIKHAGSYQSLMQELPKFKNMIELQSGVNSAD